MKTTKTFENATLRTVNSGYIELDSNGKTYCFNNASIISIKNSTITIEVDWKPERGELIKIKGSCIDSYSIFDSLNDNLMRIFGYKRIKGTDSKLQNDFWFIGATIKISPVTPEEQQAFDDFCKSQGKIWNKEKLQWEEYKWMPKENEVYYIIYGNGEVDHLRYKRSEFQDRYINFGNYFQTKEQAQKVAEEVKKLLKSL